MHWKTALILLGIAAALTVMNAVDAVRDAVALAERSRQGLLIPFPTDEIRRFRLTRAGQSLALDVDTDGAWEVTEPYRDAASPDIVEALRSLAAYARMAPQEVPTDAVGDDAPRLDLVGPDATITLFFGPASSDGATRLIRLEDPLDGASLHRIETAFTGFLDRPAAEFRRMALLGDAAERAVEITLSGTLDGQMLFVRDGKGWTLRTPVPWPAHVARVERLLRLCAEARATGIVAERAPDRTDFGFHADGPSISILTAKGERHILRLVPEGEAALAFVEGRAPIFRMEPHLLRDITGASVEVWRKHMLDLLDGTGELSALHIRNPGGEVRLEFIHNTWQGTAPVSFPVDPQAIVALTREIASLTARQFVADKQDDAAHGFAQPYAELRLIGKDGSERVRFLTGNEADGDLRFARTAARPQVFTISKRGITFLEQPWFAWRDRLIARFEWKHPRELRIIRDGTETVYRRTKGDMWQMTAPDRAMADVLRLYTGPFGEEGLGGLRALAWVSENPRNPADFGLDRPPLRVVVEFDSVGGTILPALDIEIGKATEIPTGKGYFARQRTGAGTELIFVMPEHVVQLLEHDYRDTAFKKETAEGASGAATPREGTPEAHP